MNGRVMKVAIIAIGILAVSTIANAQTMSKEQTITKVSDAVAEIQKGYPSNVVVANMGSDLAKKIINDAISKASKLQSELKDNPFIQVKGFSVGTSGISLEFEFKS